MPRPNHSPECPADVGCKIRKRGCSSSSSSSVLRSYRLKRAILVGRRGGTSTPVPTWRVNARSPCSSAGMSNRPHLPPPHGGGKAKQAPVSARKLANALWELNEIPAPEVAGNAKEDRRLKRGKTREGERLPKSVHSGSLPPHLSDPSHSPVSQTFTDRSGSGSHRRRRRRRRHLSQSLRFINERHHRALDSVINGSSMEIETRSGRGGGGGGGGGLFTPTSCIMMGIRNRLKDLSNSLMASNELLKILDRIWGIEEQQQYYSSSSVSLVSALHTELERACVQVDQLLVDQRSEQNEVIKCLKRRFMEERSAWKRKEQERVTSATESILEELELERRLRRRSERLSQKLQGELTEAKVALADATKELESERRSREIVEQVCDELVRGIGEDKAQVEEMKRESAKALEELEKEREMLQLADMWREERVQMKLLEAKYHFEEKNAAVDQLRNELEAFLATRRSKEDKAAVTGKHGKGQDQAGEERQLIKPAGKSYVGSDVISDSRMNEDGEVVVGQVDVTGEKDDDESAYSADSDLHSIELNMDNNSRSYSWNYATGNVALQDNNRKPVPVEGKYKERSSNNNDNMSRSSFSIEGGSGMLGADDNENFHHLGEVVDQSRPNSESTSLLKRQTRKVVDPDTERYKSVKGLRDHLLSSSRIFTRGGAGAGGFTSPMRRPQPSPEDDGRQQLGEGVSVAEMVRALQEGGSMKARGFGAKRAGEGHDRFPG